MLRHPDTFIKYNDEYNPTHQLFKDALDESSFREYIRIKARAVWNPKLVK